MESKSGTRSVIARLMGLDDLPNQHQVSKGGRVLSEKYFQKVASIGVRERTPAEEHSDSFRVVGTSNRDSLHRYSVERERFSSESSDLSDMLQGSAEVYDALGNTPYPSKSRLDLVHQGFLDPTEIVLLKPCRKTEENHMGDFSWLISGKALDIRKSRHYYSSLNGDSCYDLNARGDCLNENEHFGQRPRVSHEEVEEISRQMKLKNSNFLQHGTCLDFGISRKNKSCSTVSSSGFSYVNQEGKRQISERCKMIKHFQNLGPTSRVKTLGEMLSMHNQGLNASFSCSNPCDFSQTDSAGMQNGARNFLAHPRTRAKDRTLSFNWSKRSRISGNVADSRLEKKGLISKEDSSQGKSVSGCVNSHLSHSVEPECNSSGRKIELITDELDNKLREFPSESNSPSQYASLMQKELKKHEIWNLLQTNNVAADAPVDMGSSSAVSSQDVIEQDESVETPKEGSVSSYCSSECESFKSFEEVCQVSPDSVLAPFEDDTSPNLSADLSGIQIDLSYNLEASDISEEGSGMTVSSDEDSDDKSSSNFQETEDFVRFFRIKESRDFCYVIDLLSKAGLHGISPVKSFGKWHSPECPVSSLVFETLEKKYGEQKTWKRSERKLLFDRVNLGLMEILQQVIGFVSKEKSVSVRVSTGPEDAIIEEVLWNGMVREEKEAKKESSDNVLENSFEWSDLGEYVDVIARELENLLVDELAAEFLSW